MYYYGNEPAISGPNNISNLNANKVLKNREFYFYL
jgi:hypothetical protein